MRWTEARDYCATLGAHLVAIESKIENDFVYQLNPNTWIGLTDETQEGEWLSVTGEPVIYTNWTYSEPDNCAHGCGGRPAYSSEEDYAHFEVNSHQWGDWAFEKTPFVCEWESPK
jgi:hypothetical protein